MINRAFIKQNLVEAELKTLVDEALHTLNTSNSNKDSINALRKVQQVLEILLADCKAANDKYFEFCTEKKRCQKLGGF